MSNFPTSLDDDLTLPRVDNNITEQGADAVNALRDAVLNVQSEIGSLAIDGYTAAGTAGSIANRLGVALDSYGNIKSSAIASLGLIALPLTDSQVSATAAIQESKLLLDHSTTDLYNLIVSALSDINTSLSFISNSGSKVEPHISGTSFNHYLSHILVSSSIGSYFKNKSGTLRDNTNLYNLFNDVNKDFVAHQKADGTTLASDPTLITTGTIPPANYAHNATGVHIDTTNFTFIPKTAIDLQQFSQFVDTLINNTSVFSGTRAQTLFSNGISKTARSSSITELDVGPEIIPYTSATTYLLNSGASSPVDDIDSGDDVVLFNVGAVSGNLFDAKFSQVKPGDKITINYGTTESTFLIKEKKYVDDGVNRLFVVRINGKNLLATVTAQAKINKPLANDNKYGVLATAVAPLPATISGAYPSLIVSNPASAKVLGLNFNADLIDQTHYKLYLQLFPTGKPSEGAYTLPAIDITGNKGNTPGAYTLDSIIEATNAQFRKPGYNYRFIAYKYKGEFGIMMADAYNNASFSIIAGILGTSGEYDSLQSSASFPLNVVNVFDDKDALGFGPNNASVASPSYLASYSNTSIAKTPTKVFSPLTKENYYVNGVERDKLDIQPNQLIDGYGDGYWDAKIQNKQIIAGTRVKVVYQINYDLTYSDIAIGKTIVVQPEGSESFINCGRFTIEDVEFNTCACDGYTNYALITVYDGIHGTGSTPYSSLPINSSVRVYFNNDSVGFNLQNLSDTYALANTFKRYFEVLSSENGKIFTHERARILANSVGTGDVDLTVSSSGAKLYGNSLLNKINIYKVSPKLRGYSFSDIKKISLRITALSTTTGAYQGYLCRYDGTTESNFGPTTVGKQGNVVRFYDETNVDYVDVLFDLNDSVSTISSTSTVDIQLFSSLSLDDEVMLISTCQLDDVSKQVKYLNDSRQFGNISEKNLTTSALDYISATAKLTNENGVINGFDITSIITATSKNANIYINGGTALVNGKIIQMNNETVAIPAIKEYLAAYPSNLLDITWFLCLNDKAEFEMVASTDYNPSGPYASYYGSLDHNRIFYAKNQNNSTGSAYKIKASYFADIVQNHKDLLPVAIVKPTVSLSGTKYIVSAVSYEDARRFVSNGNIGLASPFILSENGSFRSYNSVYSWLNQLTGYVSYANTSSNSYSSTILVRGIIDVSNKSFEFGTRVKFIGDGGTLYSTTDLSGKNIEFSNLTFNFGTSVSNGIVLTGTNLVNNCVVKYTGSATISSSIKITSGSSIVSNCRFINDSGPSNAYVYATSASNQIVIANIFSTGTQTSGGTITATANISG